MGKSNFKKVKYEGQILERLNTILRRSVGDERLQSASITKVVLSPDFSHANIFWDTFDMTKRNNIEPAFQKFKGRARTLLAEILKVRSVPNIHFQYDSQYEDEKYISDLLQGVAKQDNNPAE